jgi:hypothetical protein
MTFAAASQPSRLPAIGTSSLATNSVLEYSGGSGATRASFYGRLKDFYLPAWDDHIHEEVKLAKVLAKKRGTMGGTRALSSVMNALPQSAGIALQEYDDMPTPSVSSHFNPQLIARGLYSRLRWSLNVRNAARAGDKAAWAEPQREDIEGAKKQFEINFERMLWTGNRNVLATLSAAESGASDSVQTVAARNTRAAGSANYKWAFGTHYLRVNQAIAFVDAASTNVDIHAGQVDSRETAANVRFIKSIDAAANTFVTCDTIGGAASDSVTTTAANQLVIPWQSRLNLAELATGADVVSTDSGMSAMNGLGNLAVSSSEVLYVLGQSRSTYDSLNARVMGNGGTVRPFDERFISLAIDRISDEGRGDEPDTMFMHASVRREYVRETQGDRRFEPVQQKKGFKSLAFTANDTVLPVQTSRDCPPGSVFILDSSTFGYFEECPMKMVDDNMRFVADKAAHEVLMVKSGNVACVAPFNNGCVEDISFDVGALTA